MVRKGFFNENACGLKLTMLEIHLTKHKEIKQIGKKTKDAKHNNMMTKVTDKSLWVNRTGR